MALSPLDDEHAPLYTVGQVAEMLAVKQAFLRRVDDLQVVSMADEGITLQAIRRIIELEEQLAAVTAERDELARRLAGLLHDH